MDKEERQQSILYCHRKETKHRRILQQKDLNSAMSALFAGVGVAMTRDPATLMVGQYFKRKRELIEIILGSILQNSISAENVLDTFPPNDNRLNLIDYILWTLSFYVR
jgi:hypothetical protein